MPLGTPLGPPPVTIHHSPRRKAHPSGVQPPTQSNLSRSTITGSTDQLQYQSGSGYPSDRGSPFHNETHYYLPSGATHVIRSNPAGILPEGASSNQNQNGAINNNSKYKSNVLQQIARSLEPHAIERPSDRERPASGSSASSSSGYGHLPLAPLMHHSVEQPTYPYHLSNYGLASSYGMGQSNAHAKRYQSTPHCDLANNNTPEAQTISKQIRQLIDNGCDKDALDLVKETLMQDSFKSSAQSSHGQLGSSTNIQSKSGSNSCLVDRMQQPYMPHKLRKPPVPSYTSLESESGLYSGATSEKSASSVRSDSPVVSSGQLVSSREQLRVATKGDHRYHTSMVSYQHSSTLDSNANMPYPQSTSYASHYAYSNSSSASSLAASSSSSLSGQYHRFPSQATPSPPNVFSNASQSTPGQFGNSTKHLSGGKMHMSSQAGSTSTRNPYHRMMSPTRSALHPPNPSSQSGMHSGTVSHSSSGFRPTDPLPPPPLPHRTTSTVAPPPPPPLHSQFISSQDASSRIPSSTNSTSGTPQQTDSLTPGKHFMKSQLASTHYVAGRSSSSNYASSASSSSPQRVTSPTHGEDFKGISFNSRYSAAPATVLSSNSGNTPSPSASLCSNSSNALVSQVSQKLHNLSLASSAQSAPSNSLHSSYTSLGFMPTSPTQSYAASSSSGLQSPTPTMSSSSDYTPVSMLPPKRQMPPTSQSTGLQQSSSASHLQNLHHIQSPNSSSSSMHSINTQSSSSLNTANLKPYNSVGVSKQVSLQAWSARQAISQSPIIMKSVKSQQVQKPVLQTAVAPTIPPINIKTTVSTSTSVASSVRLSAPSGIAIQPTAPLSPNSIMSTEALSETSTSQLSPNSTSSKSNSRGVKNPPPYPALQSSAVSPTPSSSSSAQGGLGGELSHPPPSYTSLLQHTASRANISSASNYYRVSKVNTASKNNSPATVSSEESKPGSPLALPPPPYGVTLSMSQNDSIAQIISGLSSPTPSNSSNQSQVVVPTTDPPSYASSMAALAAQRAVVVLPTGSPTTHSESGSLVDRNSSISPSELLHVAKSTKGTVMTASDASTCQLQEPSVISPHSNCDLVNTVESICTSQVSALQAGITCGPPRAPESTGPPLPPKPSGNGSAPGPPPPPPHTHFLQHAHIVSDEVSQSSDSVIDYDLESVSDYQTYLAVPSLDGETGNVRNFHESQSSSMSVITNANVCKSPTLQEDETDMDGSQDLFEETPDGIKKRTHHSPIPTRRSLSRAKEKERRDFKLRNYSPAAFKFYMEQHVENLIKSQQQRERRREQLESEMMRAGLSKDDQAEMRRMLHQKESNYIRLRRAKMDKSMFEKLRTIGVGAFGEVALVRKIDANLLYAMKTLRKSDVLKRNQVAHVKAERDILAEADNEWVVKLYYSFQDEEHLYFVMDYIPGGDLMSLLIKFGIFEEKLAKFYIAELVLAVESVHKMGFIHRDIKPDNVLIDKEGHIKLTDFGLCTGFRWTHNSKYYHERADSMDFEEAWSIGPSNCSCQPCMNPCKTLERRKRREHQRCLAHSLVGTPNYIAPEVLKRTGYTQLCDWWSVGVILYEMVVGQPPFFANTPEETQQKVINWEKTLRIPSEAKLSTEVTDFILRLCCGAENRLGRNGADEIKSHAFFKSINFNENLREKQAPYLPTIQHPLDTSNFDSYDEENMGNSYAVDLNRANGTKNSKHPEHAFFEFTFRRFFDSCEPIRITNEDSTDSNLSEPSDLYEEVARSMPHASSPPNVLRSVGSPCSSPGGGNPQGSVTTLTPTGSNHSPAESVKEGGDAQNAVYV